ncbi:MAG: lysylphosphatidylglycerol synthase transmembrane domain-containing protein [Planctomycetota bacterium]|jgi:uncharacterized protein (TIRG00374 family)
MLTKGSGKKKHILLFFRIAFVFIGVAILVIWASRENRWKTLSQIDPVVFLVALAIFILGQSAVGFRWWLLLRSQSVLIPVQAAVKLHFLGLFYNNCMPGSVGGDLVRAGYVTMHTEKKFEAALSVFVDRFIGLLSTLAIAMFFYIVFLKGKGIPMESSISDGIIRHKVLLAGVFVSILIICAVLLAFSRTRLLLYKLWLFAYSNASHMATKMKNALIIYCKSPLTVFLAFCLTVSLQIATITGFWLIGKSLGITASIKYYYVFFTLTWVLGAVPISIGGAGVVEAMLIILFVKIAKVPEASAFALTLSQRFIWIIASLAGAVIHLKGKHLPKDFFVDYDNPIK